MLYRITYLILECDACGHESKPFTERAFYPSDHGFCHMGTPLEGRPAGVPYVRVTVCRACADNGHGLALVERLIQERRREREEEEAARAALPWYRRIWPG